MNEQTNTSGSQLLSFMKPIYPIVVPAAITAMTLSLVTFDGRRDEHGNEVYLPVSNTPDQPHQHNENYEQTGTTIAKWGASGTNTSATLTNATWTSTTLLMPFDSDLFVVERLRQAGLFLIVASESPIRLELIE